MGGALTGAGGPLCCFPLESSIRDRLPRARSQLQKYVTRGTRHRGNSRTVARALAPQLAQRTLSPQLIHLGILSAFISQQILNISSRTALARPHPNAPRLENTPHPRARCRAIAPVIWPWAHSVPKQAGTEIFPPRHLPAISSIRARIARKQTVKLDIKSQGDQRPAPRSFRYSTHARRCVPYTPASRPCAPAPYPPAPLLRLRPQANVRSARRTSTLPAPLPVV